MTNNSLLKMNNKIFTSRSFESQMFGNSFESASYSLEGDERLALECQRIMNTNSYEALDKEFVRDCNELSFSIGVYNNHVQRFAHDRVVVKRFLTQFKNESYATEAANDMIHMMSLENAKSFLGKTWAWIKEQFKKLALMAMKVAKMFANFIRGKVASLQSALYTKLAASLGKLLKENGSKEVKYRKFVTDVDSKINSYIKGIESTIKKVSDISSKIDEKESRAISDGFLGMGKTVNVPTIVKWISKSVGKEISGTDDAMNTTVIVNEMFYGSKKKPQATMQKINSLLSEKTFKAVSKEWLNNLESLVKSANNLSKECSVLVKKVEKIANNASKFAEDKEEKQRLSKKVKDLNAIRSVIQVLEMFVREFFWAALDYRTTVYKLAKSCTKGEKKETK